MTPHRDNLDAAFRILASDPAQAPDRVEAALITAFRRRRTLHCAAWSSSAAAIAAAAVIAIAMLRVPQTPLPKPVAFRIEVPAPATRLVAKVRRPKPPRRTPAQPAALRFYALSDPDTPLEYGQVVRVELPRSALTAVGRPLDESRRAEPIQAEVLFGQDGRARAVRFLE